MTPEDVVARAAADGVQMIRFLYVGLSTVIAPPRWSSAAAFLGRQNREAVLRICPVVAILSDGLARANPEEQCARYANVV